MRGQKRSHPSLPILLICLAGLSGNLQATETTYNGVTATWNVNLTDLTFLAASPATNFRYSSRQFSPLGNMLTITITVPKQYFRQGWPGSNYLELLANQGGTTRTIKLSSLASVLKRRRQRWLRRSSRRRRKAWIISRCFPPINSFLRQ